jgi:hypothetical protein
MRILATIGLYAEERPSNKGRIAEMKQLLALLAAALLAVYACSCGDSSKNTNAADSTSHTAPTGTSAAASIPPATVETNADADKDNDAGTVGEDTRNNRIPNFGHAADTSDLRAITSLVKRYYAAALTEDGAKACSLLYSTLAEAIPEDYSGTPGVSYMHGAKTCAEAMTLLFKHYHPQLVLEVPKLQVHLVRLEQNHGVGLLSFGRLPERETSFLREGHVWKMTALLDREIE